MNLVNTIRKSRIRAFAAVLAVAGSALFAAVPTAGATSISEYPHFQCYSYANGTALLKAEPPKVNQGETITEWGVAVQRWNPSTRSWYTYVTSGVQYLNNDPTSFSELAQSSDEWNVAPHSYYRVFYALKDNTDSRAQWAPATPIHNHYGATTCWT
jgi:hypothetical protein